MVWLEWVIKIGAAITAVVALWRGVVFLVHFLDGIKEDIAELKDHSKENYLGIKRLTVMSHDMPIGERIVAANDYIKAGGNGEVKTYIKEHLHIDDVQND